jgi:hypothetical protein
LILNHSFIKCFSEDFEMRRKKRYRLISGSVIFGLHFPFSDFSCLWCENLEYLRYL